jgi:hypothetical protein
LSISSEEVSPRTSEQGSCTSWTTLARSLVNQKPNLNLELSSGGHDQVLRKRKLASYENSTYVS